MIPAIQLKKDCYFIHGIYDWNKNKNHNIGITTPEISCSIHKENFTIPLRPYGYILKVYKDGIIKAFDTDVSSYYDYNFKKKVGYNNNYKEYDVTELDDLVTNTTLNSHNELWIKCEYVEIVGAYFYGDTPSTGEKAFEKECRKNKINIINIINKINIIKWNRHEL